MTLKQRRLVPLAATAATSLALLAACGSDASSSADRITAANYGGVSGETIAESLGDPFSAESGIDIQHVASGVGFVAKVQAQHNANSIEWDVIEGAGGQEAARLWGEGMLEPLPDDLRSELQKVSIPNAVTEYGVLLGMTGYIIACNMEMVEACPSNPAEFWDTENFPGRRAMISSPFGMMATALVADGVPTDEVFPMDIDRAFKKLEEIKSAVNVWTTSGDQQVQVMRDGQVGMSIIWNGRAKSVIDSGVPLQLEWDGSLANPNYMVVVKDAPNKEAAMDYLEYYATHAEPQAEVARKLAYGMSHKDVVNLLTEEEAALLPEGGSNADNQVWLDGEWWLENADKVEPQWSEFLTE